MPGSDFEASDFDEVLAAVLAAEVPTEVTGSKDGGKWRGLLPPAMRSRDLLPTAGRPEDSAVGGAAAGGRVVDSAMHSNYSELSILIIYSAA